ncbi:PIF1 [Symbiodinium pilosum]|uniref:PIF1 protein n=1 Tax=Symbiodinium pilosum TaxID=2952 RepID=A0A812VXC0_SYMPI|nr:PIF1 [Symbiodinium pilosum]
MIADSEVRNSNGSIMTGLLRTETGCIAAATLPPDGVLRARPIRRILQLLKITEQPAPGTISPVLPLSRLQQFQNRLHKRAQVLEQLDPRRCAQATSAGCETFCDFSWEPGAVAALARHLPLVQSRCVQGSYSSVDKKLWIARKDLAQAALDIRTWKGDRAAETYAGKMPKNADSNTPQSDWPQLLLRLGAACAREKSSACGSCAQGPPSNPTEGFLSPEPVQARLSCEGGFRNSRRSRTLWPLADVAINEDGLPTPTDTLASQVVGRCKHGSLSICTQCHSVQARCLEPSDLRRTAPALMSPKVCAAGKHQESVPQPEDIPVALQRLRPRVLAALRFLDVDAGVYQTQRAPHGYRVHTAMIRFSWASTSVDNQIQALPDKKDRRRATKALGHLLTCTDSAYHTFYDLHPDFLRRHGTNVQEKMRKLPLSFLETPGRGEPSEHGTQLANKASQDG